MSIPPNNIYCSIHLWLKNNYGKANQCEQKNCDGISKKYEWSKLKDKIYEFNRENFWMLCVNCHRKYDCLYRLPRTEREIYRSIKDVRLHLALDLDEFAELINIPLDTLVSYEKQEFLPTIKILRTIYNLVKDKLSIYWSYSFERHVKYLDYKSTDLRDE